MELIPNEDHRAKAIAFSSNISELKIVFMTTVQKLPLYVCSLPTPFPKDSLLGNYQSQGSGYMDL